MQYQTIQFNDMQNYALPDTKQFHAVPYDAMQYNGKHKNLICGPFFISGRKQHFWAPRRPLWAIGAEKRPAERPNGQLPENQRYPELPQDMGDL